MNDAELIRLAERLQRHYSGKCPAGTVAVGVGDEMLYIYHRCDVSKILPEWFSDSGVPVEFIPCKAIPV